MYCIVTSVAEQETLGFQEAIPLVNVLVLAWAEAVALEAVEVVGINATAQRTRAIITAIR